MATRSQQCETGYDNGCRCGPCSRWYWSKYQRERTQRRKRENPPNKVCDHCGKGFFSDTKSARFCSGSCRGKGAARRGPKNPLQVAINDKDVDKFFSLVRERCEIDTRGCWIWKDRLSAYGYAAIYVHGKSPSMQLIRVVLSAKHGWMELGKNHAHHICAVRACVNPDHLQLATHAENVGEMKARNAYISRIEALESVVREFDPGHKILTDWDLS